MGGPLDGLEVEIPRCVEVLRHATPIPATAAILAPEAVGFTEHRYRRGAAVGRVARYVYDGET